MQEHKVELLDVSPSLEEPTQTSTAPSARTSFIVDFRIIRKLGEGGMGVVYEAEEQHPRRAVALKVIRGGTYVDDHAVKLFQREAQAPQRGRGREKTALVVQNL